MQIIGLSAIITLDRKEKYILLNKANKILDRFFRVTLIYFIVAIILLIIANSGTPVYTN